jgi:hypothetical protein
MLDDRDFTAEQFQRMSYIERIRACRLQAVRARELGRRSAAPHRDSYLRIADEWNRLASDIEQQLQRAG